MVCLFVTLQFLTKKIFFCLTISYGHFQNNSNFNFSFSLFFLIIILTFANKIFVDNNLTEGILCLTNKKNKKNNYGKTGRKTRRKNS